MVSPSPRPDDPGGVCHIRGFQPTDHGAHDHPRRGATHETVCHTARYRRINRRAATEYITCIDSRGLKPTATIMRSLPRPRPQSCNHEMCIFVRPYPGLALMNHNVVPSGAAVNVRSTDGTEPRCGSISFAQRSQGSRLAAATLGLRDITPLA